MKAELLIGDEALSPNAVWSAAVNLSKMPSPGIKIVLSDNARNRIAASAAIVQGACHSETPIYGLNTEMMERGATRSAAKSKRIGHNVSPRNSHKFTTLSSSDRLAAVAALDAVTFILTSAGLKMAGAANGKSRTPHKRRN